MSPSRRQMIIVMLLGLTRCQHCLDNGLALTPPLGWISSERFQCLTDCTNYPDDCISEKLVKTTTDAMVKQGFKGAGYQYVILGDCWMNKTRDIHGNIQPDTHRFPGGMKSLAQYVHDRGLLLSVEVDLSNSSCNGYPGSYNHYQRDASTLAAWGVDYVRATACSFTQNGQLDTAYPAMSSALNQTGRPMVFDCNWPLESKARGQQPDYSRVQKTCNVYTTDDMMKDSWESLEKSIKYAATLAKDLVNFTGPGSWNVPNLVLVGNYGLSAHEQAMQLAVWSIMNAPLLVSADLRSIQDYQRDLLLHKGILSIDRDVTYSLGTEITLKGQVHIWKKDIQPRGSYALLFMYFNISGGPSRVSVVLRDIGVHGAERYQFTNILTGESLGVYHSWYTFDCLVDPVGSLYVRVEALPPRVQRMENNIL